MSYLLVDMGDPEAMGSLIKRLRFMQGMTQRDLAGRLGINQTRLSNIEGGRARTATPTFVRIIAAMGHQALVAVQIDTQEEMADGVMRMDVEPYNDEVPAR